MKSAERGLNSGIEKEMRGSEVVFSRPLFEAGSGIFLLLVITLGSE